MGFRNNDPTTFRDFFFTPAGRNARTGLSRATAVADPNQAITNTSALIPPPGPSDPASINAAVSGTYDTGVIIPEFVTCKSSSASIITTDAINVQALGRHEVEWGSLLNLSNGGICFEIDGKTRVAAEVNACVPVGEDGIGFNVTGVCDEIFVQLRLGDIQGERGVMFNHTANSPTPIQYMAENITFNDDDQTAILYNDPVGTTATVFNISDIQTRNGGTVAPGSTAAHIIAGIAVVDSDVLNAETIALVEDGGILTLSAQNIFGDTLIEDGGIAIYPSMALCVGDLETDGTGSLQTRITNIVGDAINDGSMSILSDQLDGQITNTGDMFVVIGDYTGTIPPDDGGVDGVLNGKRLGNWNLNPAHYGEYFESEGVSSTSSTAYQDKIDETTPALPAGRYRVEWSAEVTNNSGDKPCEFTALVDGTMINEGFYPPKFEDEYLSVGGFKELPLTAGTHQLEVQWRTTDEGGTARIRRARIKIIKVGV